MDDPAFAKAVLDLEVTDPFPMETDMEKVTAAHQGLQWFDNVVQTVFAKDWTAAGRMHLPVAPLMLLD